ncbi:hypothetical protein Ssi03_08150 [Sphaerisporangium siamense]|uniref:Outer membrane channel protein CpnT-like N-terminal domain-containing protein n=1 Tax=Sphaerisporangium siamense TaxID=795645 RepID=A0A7W7GC84_9ACTN|nr:DUF4258 domain-containing protein [Sphaerisporangium siamense]MBB4705788.1 hypothetical protein [Sphaerisporangium siamense]GII82825.1 hypothetical protein Ssi03_08150 [Sphaerisporangium siamense]
MDVTLPPWAATVLNLAGVPWPNIRESALRAEAQAWRDLGRLSGTAAQGADGTVVRTSGTYQGASATALAGHWDRTGGGGHLGLAAHATRYAPVLLDGAATVVTGTKIAIISQAAVAAVRLASTMLAGGPLALGTATATVLATRYAMARILREAGEGGARVLAPGLTRRVTEPLANILRNARGPGGGPALAGAGGRVVTPRGLGAPGRGGNPLDDLMMTMGRGKKGGGGGTSGHARKRQSQRGISDDMVQQAIATGRQVPGKTADTVVHLGRNVAVVRNKKTGKIITTYRR